MVSLPHLVRFGKTSSFQNCCPGSISHIFTSTFAAGWALLGLKPHSATAPKALSSPGHGLYSQDREQRCPNSKTQVVMPTIIPTGFCRLGRHPGFTTHQKSQISLQLKHIATLTNRILQPDLRDVLLMSELEIDSKSRLIESCLPLFMLSATLLPTMHNAEGDFSPFPKCQNCSDCVVGSILSAEESCLRCLPAHGQ